MNVIYHENYVKLSDMNTGDTATSADRKSFFVCGHHYDQEKQYDIRVILDLNNLNDQRPEDMDMEQPVKILKSGDQFHCSI
jgi:hypothetical protein